jgi:hypothetical protein
MTILTAEQRQAIEQAGDQPVEVMDPQTEVAYVLLRADLFQEARELLEKERQRQAIAQKAKRDAAARMNEPDTMPWEFPRAEEERVRAESPLPMIPWRFR